MSFSVGIVTKHHLLQMRKVTIVTEVILRPPPKKNSAKLWKQVLRAIQEAMAGRDSGMSACGFSFSWKELRAPAWRRKLSF